MAFYFMASYSIILAYFDKKKGRALALHSCFYGIGGLPGPFWVTLCFSEYGYTGTLIIVAAITLHTIPAGLCFRPLSVHQKCVRKEKQPVEEATPSDGKGTSRETEYEMTVSDTFKDSQSTDKVYKIDCCGHDSGTQSESCNHLLQQSGLSHLSNLITLAYMLCGLSFNAVYELNITLAAGLAKDKYFSTDEMRTLLSITNGVDIIMRIIGGLMIDYFEKWRPLVYSILMMLIGVLAILLPLIESKVASIVVWVIFQGLIGEYDLKSNC